ncbi:MAG: glycoside hydrolase family 127 protein [Lachnospiraceae bacterium]|nr:glycoside hydrolase family 127 protein [Lachnospiraceae bacterium]
MGCDGAEENRQTVSGQETTAPGVEQTTETEKPEETIISEEDEVNLEEVIEAFKLDQIEVTDDYCVNALDKEMEYLLAFDADKLLAGFRDTAGLDMKGATRYAGWEDSLIGGHTMGHFLSAMAQAYVNTGISEEDRAKVYETMTYIIDELLVCQENSKGEPGFIFGATVLDYANVELQFDNVEEGKCNITTQAWVPWYTMHKILAGIVDVYELTGYEPALKLAVGLSDWVAGRTSGWDTATAQKVRQIEFGGMNDIMYEMYGLTGTDAYAVSAHCFDHENIYKVVYADNENALNDKHANTTIPKFIGALKRYTMCDGRVIDGETVDASLYLEYAKSFWDMVVNKHTYVTGANSEWEHFGMDYVLDAERTNANNETCNVYNMLKLTKMLFEITGDVKYADYYEAAYCNAILASQNPETGMSTYFQPMATGYFRVFGTRWTKFWCCTGTGMENFTKLGDSIYFRSGESIYVNLYQSSTLRSEEDNIVLDMSCDLESSEEVTITVTTMDSQATDKNIKLRIPGWIALDMAISVDGEEYAYEAENGYAVIAAGLESGSVVKVTLPMKVVAYALPDAPNSVAFKYGPYVLAATLGTEDMQTTTTGVAVTIPAARVTDCDNIILPSGSDASEFIENADDYFEKNAGEGLTFTLKAAGLTFKPYYRVYEERYGLYFYVTTQDEIDKINLSRVRSFDTATDTVQPGYGQYENDELHAMTDNGSVGQTESGTSRYATEGGSFSYRMAVKTDGNMYLQVTLLASDNGKTLRITSGDALLFEDVLDYIGLEESYELRVKIPAEVLAGAVKVNANDQEYDIIDVTFAGMDGKESAQVSGFIYMYDVEPNYESDESIAYFVDCGDYDTTTISEGDTFGVYNSVTEQLYGYDPVTGKKWGLIDDANDKYNGSGNNDGLYTAHTWCYEFNNSDGLDKTASNRYTKNQYEDGYTTRFLDYAFELPNGTYAVEIGFANPWNCSNGHDVYANLGKESELMLAEAYNVSGGPLTADVAVTDGVLTLNFRNSTQAGLAINVTYIKISFVE